MRKKQLGKKQDDAGKYYQAWKRIYELFPIFLIQRAIRLYGLMMTYCLMLDEIYGY